MAKPATIDTDEAPMIPQDLGDAETIAMLQDEIARLEAELLARHEASEVAAAQMADRSEPGGLMADRCDEADQLRAELTSRDETIALLMEQLQLVEEAEAASKAEWDQLVAWVNEVERRVEKHDEVSENRLRTELEEQKRQNERLREQAEQRAQSWASQKSAYETEIEAIRAALAQVAAGDNEPHAADAAAVNALEAENRRLRETCLQLSSSTAALADIDVVRGRLEAALAELFEVRQKLEITNDDRERERKEYEAAVHTMRANLSRAAIVKPLEEDRPLPPEVEVETETQVSTGNVALEVDMRIRAFRQHLKELHESEAEERNKNRLSARLSRLWNRTRP
jgi:hypothetical protein